MTIPCQQERTLERIEIKLDSIGDKVHSIDLRVAKIETTQEVQKDYVEARSKRNGQYYGTISGVVVGVILMLANYVLDKLYG